MPEPAIIVRRPRPDDAAALVATMGDPDVLPQLLQLPYATEAMWRKRIEDMPVGATTTDLTKACWAGGTIQIYVNPGALFDPTRRPTAPTYAQVRTAIVGAFLQTEPRP